MVDYFKEIFTSSNPLKLNVVLDDVDYCISSDMATTLEEPFMKAEILAFLHQIHHTKAPSPDAMPVLFFQKFCHVIDKDVLHTILTILNDNMDPFCLNKTHIMLVSKFLIQKIQKISGLLAYVMWSLRLLSKLYLIDWSQSYLILFIRPKMPLFQVD